MFRRVGPLQYPNHVLNLIEIGLGVDVHARRELAVRPAADALCQALAHFAVQANQLGNHLPIRLPVHDFFRRLA